MNLFPCNSQEFLALGRTMGTPIHIDRTQSDFGYFAKVLVDIDLAEPIPNKVLVEVEDGDFWQKVELGTLPKFCPHCKMVGHNLAECRGARAQVQREEEIKDKRNQEEARKGEVGEDQDTIEEQNQALILVEECKNKDSGIGYTSASKEGVASISSGTGVNANSSAGTYAYITAQLIRETSLVLVNKEENWADMVEDEERDEACVAKSTSQSKTNTKKAVHASTFKIVRRGLWKELVTVSQLNLPWLAVGDFNIIRLQSERFGGWCAPPMVADFLGEHGIDLRMEVNRNLIDKRLWRHHTQGTFTVRSALDAIRSKNPKWLIDLFMLNSFPNNMQELLGLGETMSRYIKDLWRTAVINLSHLIWLARNSIIFREERYNGIKIKVHLMVLIKEAASPSVNSMHNTIADLQMISKLGVKARARPAPCIASCRWKLPWFEEINLNCYSSTLGNPGKSGLGVIARTHSGKVLGVRIKGLGVLNRPEAECCALLEAMSWAADMGWQKIWL
ncbi:hypothetical protein GIB67_018067 [Kingdonia uniflora]|uniref:RNase H type-1 domain-containing protein n=1 Tax=Kingdonia uniflora TaxID=39325 RepID=A0A7J7NWR7_9MAGN|nr:hypothetical protein GIB67_018067 [Kingdonia uniflora]